MDELSYPGNLIECKVLGVIEAEQTEEGKTMRNDRLIAAAVESHRYKEFDDLKDLDKYLLKEITNSPFLPTIVAGAVLAIIHRLLVQPQPGKKPDALWAMIIITRWRS